MRECHSAYASVVLDDVRACATVDFVLKNRLSQSCDRRFGCVIVVLDGAPARAYVNFLLQGLNCTE